MRRIITRGIFGILHPDHIHYLSGAASLGDELHVIIVHGKNAMHKPKPIFDNRQRRDMVTALNMVDEVHLSHTEDIFVPIEGTGPSATVLGYDQHHDEDRIEAVLDTHGIDCEVTCATPRELHHDSKPFSTGRIIDRIVERHY